MVWIWGENRKAELGLGDSATRDVPFPLCQLKDKAVGRIFVGKSYSIAIVGSQKEITTYQEKVSQIESLGKT
jgi:hypothetical protein